METTSLSVLALLALLFPAYLQGMETPDRGTSSGQTPRSQPTYKEWKPRLPSRTRKGGGGPFPAYLQGMETILQLPESG